MIVNLRLTRIGVTKKILTNKLGNLFNLFILQFHIQDKVTQIDHLLFQLYKTRQHFFLLKILANFSIE